MRRSEPSARSHNCCCFSFFVSPAATRAGPLGHAAPRELPGVQVSKSEQSVTDRVRELFPDLAGVPVEQNVPGDSVQREFLINGEIREWAGPLTDVLSPIWVRADGVLAPRRLGAAPAMSGEAAAEALEAAVVAYDLGRGAWPTMTVSERIRHVEEFARRMKAVREEVVRYIMWEICKTRADSEKEFDRTVDYIIATVEALKEQDRASSRFSIEEGIIAQVRRAPLGVVLCMGPYNYPLNETFATLLPALIMGNTCVFKPPKLGVLLYRPLLPAFRDCFPPGVINTVYGDGAETVGPIMETGKIDVLAFIGSSRVADRLKQQHPHPHRLRSILGLGAKNAAIVQADADLALTVQETVLGSLSYNGQRCTALKIIFVHTSIAEKFLADFCAEVEKLAFGMPWEAGVKITPLPVPDKTGYLADLVADALSSGARVMNRSGGTSNRSFFYPAVLFPVSPEARIYSEEQFGPVVPIVPYEDINDPIRYVYESHYGQQVSIFGTDPNVLSVLIDPMVNQVCRVNINSQCQRGPDAFPFTGRKGSAEGTLSVSDALRSFSIRTLVAAKANDINRAIITDIVRNHKSNFLSTDFIL